jgi:hypothetical protein
MMLFTKQRLPYVISINKLFATQLIMNSDYFDKILQFSMLFLGVHKMDWYHFSPSERVKMKTQPAAKKYVRAEQMTLFICMKKYLQYFLGPEISFRLF